MTFAEALGGGDRRSVGQVERVVAAVVAAPERLPELVAALKAADPVVPMRAADALEKLARQCPEWLTPHRARLLRAAARTDDPAVRWNLVQLLPRLPHTPRAGRALARRLEVWYRTDPSAIVRACALEGVVALADRDPGLRRSAAALVVVARTDGSAAVRARTRRLQAAWLAGTGPPAA